MHHHTSHSLSLSLDLLYLSRMHIHPVKTWNYTKHAKYFKPRVHDHCRRLPTSSRQCRWIRYPTSSNCSRMMDPRESSRDSRIETASIYQSSYPMGRIHASPPRIGQV